MRADDAARNDRIGLDPAEGSASEFLLACVPDIGEARDRATQLGTSKQQARNCHGARHGRILAIEEGVGAPTA